MDYDKLVQEIDRLQEWLADQKDPSTDVYLMVQDRLIKLTKLKIEYDEACDKQLERQNKFELDKYRIDQEFEFKMKELEVRMNLESEKNEQGKAEAENRRLAEKRQALWDLAKIVLQIGGTGALILITAGAEKDVILGHNKMKLIPTPKFI